MEFLCTGGSVIQQIRKASFRLMTPPPPTCLIIDNQHCLHICLAILGTLKQGLVYNSTPNAIVS